MEENTLEEIKMNSAITGSRSPLALLAAFALVVGACAGTGPTTPPAGTDADAPSPPASATDDGAASPPASATDDGAASPPASGGGGTVDLSGASFTVGSKEFTEQLILGQITIQVLEDAGADVTDQTGITGSATVREALTSEQIDMYWEYTGTGWINHLGNDTPIPGSEAQYDAVVEADAANGIAWLEPAPFNNTYAIAAASETATDLGISSMSELAAYANESPGEARLCAASEFLNRDDGLPGLEEAYGFEFGPDNVEELELGLIPPQVDTGENCNFGEIFATDARVVSLDLTVLEDDAEFFPSYLPSLNVRQEVLDANPALAELFAPVAAALDNETITALNAQVDIDGENEADVAAEFLQDAGLVGE
ncbi:MAG: glycine betaine ABC transporter substrate-binding protein [Chloroflexota bacterium]|nr:glycine betaine ABC transporter substrate-binding protein [Chloroflexota bacterium]